MDLRQSEVDPYALSSTPVTHLPSTRKRKLDDISAFSSRPKFSSTLNDSLIVDLQDKCMLNSGLNTPEKQRISRTIVSSSPAQESRAILYSSIKVVKPERDRKFGLLKPKSESVPIQNLLNKILNINVIMDVIFKNLSSGDLYRFSLVSPSFFQALEKSADAFNRYKVYRMNYKDNKENYVITPPASPENCDSPPKTDSENFNKYFRLRRCLIRSQSLNKCFKCGGPAVVESDISQCQKPSCGFICCNLCFSSSETGAVDFKDACGHAFLRPTLGNMSNRMNESSFNFSSQDSGFYSESETPPKVKRNLFAANTEVVRALSASNKNKVVTGLKRREAISFVPVVSNPEQIQKVVDCDSPPRYRHAIGSKQSKKNLKRLTR